MQSEPKSSTKSFELIETQVSRLEASPATPRRRWSAAAKERIVMAAMAPGSNVSAIARNNGLSPQQVFAWRRQAAGPKKPTAAASFALVAVDTAEVGGMVELIVAGVTIRVGPSVSVARVAEILCAVRSG